ncbi:MAG: PAS domain-containing protein [Kiloniellaceae bacterium]
MNSRSLPPRRAFDPVDFPRALSTLILCEVMQDAALCFRLVGTDMVEAWGADFTGHRLQDIMQGDYHDFIRGLFDESIAKRAPLFSHRRFQWDRGRSLDTKRLMLPFARDDGNRADVGFVLVSQVFDYGKVGPCAPLVTSVEGGDFIELERESLNVAAGD